MSKEQLRVFTYNNNYNKDSDFAFDFSKTIKPNNLVEIDKTLLQNNKETIYSFIDKIYTLEEVNFHGKQRLAIKTLSLLYDDNFAEIHLVGYQNKKNITICSNIKMENLDDILKRIKIEAFTYEKVQLFSISYLDFNNKFLFDFDNTKIYNINKQDLPENILKNHDRLYLIDNKYYNFKHFTDLEHNIYKYSNSLINFNNYEIPVDYIFDDYDCIPKKCIDNLMSDYCVHILDSNTKRYVDINFKQLVTLDFFQKFRSSIPKMIRNNKMNINRLFNTYIKSNFIICYKQYLNFIKSKDFKKNSDKRLTTPNTFFNSRLYQSFDDFIRAVVIFNYQNLYYKDTLYYNNIRKIIRNYPLYFMSEISYYNETIISLDKKYTKNVKNIDGITVKTWSHVNNNSKITYRDKILTFENFNIINLSIAVFIIVFLKDDKISSIYFYNCFINSIQGINTFLLNSIIPTLPAQLQNYDINNYYPKHLIFVDSDIDKLIMMKNDRLKIIISDNSYIRYNEDVSFNTIFNFSKEKNKVFFISGKNIEIDSYINLDQEELETYINKNLLVNNEKFNYVLYASNKIVEILNILSRYISAKELDNFKHEISELVNLENIKSVHKAYEKLTKFYNKNKKLLSRKGIKIPELGNCHFCTLVTNDLSDCNKFFCKCCQERNYNNVCPFCKNILNN